MSAQEVRVALRAALTVFGLVVGMALMAVAILVGVRMLFSVVCR